MLIELANQEYDDDDDDDGDDDDCNKIWPMAAPTKPASVWLSSNWPTAVSPPAHLATEIWLAVHPSI